MGNYRNHGAYQWLVWTIVGVVSLLSLLYIGYQIWGAVAG